MKVGLGNRFTHPFYSVHRGHACWVRASEGVKLDTKHKLCVSPCPPWILHHQSFRCSAYGICLRLSILSHVNCVVPCFVYGFYIIAVAVTADRYPGDCCLTLSNDNEWEQTLEDNNLHFERRRVARDTELRKPWVEKFQALNDKFPLFRSKSWKWWTIVRWWFGRERETYLIPLAIILSQQL